MRFSFDLHIMCLPSLTKTKALQCGNRYLFPIQLFHYQQFCSLSSRFQMLLRTDVSAELRWNADFFCSSSFFWIPATYSKCSNDGKRPTVQSQVTRQSTALIPKAQLQYNLPKYPAFCKRDLRVFPRGMSGISASAFLVFLHRLMPRVPVIMVWMPVHTQFAQGSPNSFM